MLTPAAVRISSTSVHGVRFAPHVLLHEFFCLAALRIVQDLVHVQSYAEENLFDLVDSVRFIPGTLARQRLGRIQLVGASQRSGASRSSSPAMPTSVNRA